MHPVTNCKASKNKTNKTRQYRTLFLNKQNNNNNNNKTHTHTHTKHTHTKENEMKSLVPTSSLFILNGISINHMIKRMPFL